MKSNDATHWATCIVHRDVYREVHHAQCGAIHGVMSDTVHRATTLAVYLAVLKAQRDDPLHPAIADFLSAA